MKIHMPVNDCTFIYRLIFSDDLEYANIMPAKQRTSKRIRTIKPEKLPPADCVPYPSIIQFNALIAKNIRSKKRKRAVTKPISTEAASYFHLTA